MANTTKHGIELLQDPSLNKVAPLFPLTSMTSAVGGTTLVLERKLS